MRSLEKAVLAVSIVCFAAPVYAQVNAMGAFSGMVTDPEGKAVVNAQIRLIDQAAGISTTRLTGSEGHYVFAAVKPGVYSLEVSATGFAVATRRELVLEIQDTVEQDFKLKLAGVHQDTTVTDAAPLLSGQTTEVGNVISERTTEQLPLNGR